MDLTVPHRPRYHYPPGNANDIATRYFNPFGIRMYCRAKYVGPAPDITSYPDWSDDEQISIGPFAGAGPTATQGKSYTVYVEFAGRVPPHVIRYTERKSVTGVPGFTDTVKSLVISGAGEYSYSYSAGSKETVQCLFFSSQGQLDLLGD